MATQKIDPKNPLFKKMIRRRFKVFLFGFLVLVPIFYVTQPTPPNKHWFVVREFKKIAPSEFRAEFSQFEPEIDKLTRLFAHCAMIIEILYVLGSLRPSLFED